MSSTWTDIPEPALPPPGPMGWLRALLRAIPLATLVFGGLAVLLAVRVLERPLFGLRRPLTPHITVLVCRGALRIMGLRYRRQGRPMPEHGAMVANHASWLDIFTLNAAVPIYFVSKAEVSGWPGIGWLARATGTVFIERDRKQARAQTLMLEARLHAGHRLVFFPEGTSTDGLRVLPFKTTLFAAFLTERLAQEVSVQPVSVIYHAPPGEHARFYGWWGETGFGPHLLHTLAARRQGRVEVVYHPPLSVAAYPDRKRLAAAAEAEVRAGLEEGLSAAQRDALPGS